MVHTHLEMAACLPRYHYVLCHPACRFRHKKAVIDLVVNRIVLNADDNAELYCGVPVLEPDRSIGVVGVSEDKEVPDTMLSCARNYQDTVISCKGKAV